MGWVGDVFLGCVHSVSSVPANAMQGDYNTVQVHLNAMQGGQSALIARMLISPNFKDVIFLLYNNVILRKFTYFVLIGWKSDICTWIKQILFIVFHT